jgi:hypothetical protein
MRVVTLDSWRKARIIVADGVWGSSKTRSLDWAVGEMIVVLITREGVATANVSGSRFRSDLKAWDNDVHDWRVPLAGFVLVEGAAGQRLNTDVRDVLRRSYGEQVYFRVLLHGIRLGDDPECRIRELLQGLASAG